MIIRTSWLYSHLSQSFYSTVKNFASTRTDLRIVWDQIDTPTSAKDLAEMLIHIMPKIDSSHFGIYHYSNEGVASWCDFAYGHIISRHDICRRLVFLL